jgi:hypothetical protein
MEEDDDDDERPLLACARDRLYRSETIYTCFLLAQRHAHDFGENCMMLVRRCPRETLFNKAATTSYISLCSGTFPRPSGGAQIPGVRSRRMKPIHRRPHEQRFALSIRKTKCQAHHARIFGICSDSCGCILRHESGTCAMLGCATHIGVWQRNN